MNVSIIGAAGEVGRSLATHLLRSGLMTTADTLQLVGHGAEGTERRVLAERVDLLDAFDETAPRIEVAATPDEVAGDVVVVAGGVTVSKETRTRRELAAKNRPVFETFAGAPARNGTGRETVVIVTNPIELGVEIFSSYLDRHRVLGMGAQQDSLRFARAIADGAGVRRDRVHAWVLGEHGEAQMPFWSNVRLLGSSPEEDETLEALRAVRGPARAVSEVERHRRQMFELLAEERVREAFAAVEALPPDLRVMLEPFATAHCLHSTPNATATRRSTWSGCSAAPGSRSWAPRCALCASFPASTRSSAWRCWPPPEAGRRWCAPARRRRVRTAGRCRRFYQGQPGRVDELIPSLLGGCQS